MLYMQILNEREGRSPFSIDREPLPKYLADSFLRESIPRHALEVRAGDLESERSYKVTFSRMRILKRDYGIEWGVILPQA
jgi:hypothetical protein